MKKENKTNLENSLKNEIFKSNLMIFCIFFSLIILSTGSLFYIENKFFEKTAYSYVLNSRNSILNRDYRATFQNLNNALIDGFSALEFKDENNNIIFSLPDNKHSFDFFELSIPQNIFSNITSDKLKPIGSLTFYYSVKKSILYSLFFLILFIFSYLYFFIYWKKKIIDRHNEILKLYELENAKIFSKQVAHDIKSPLSALNMILGQIGQLPEAQRLIIRNSVNRINDIANQLLEKGKPNTKPNEIINDPNFSLAKTDLRTELLAPIIDTIVSEKRMQFRDKQNIHIESVLTQSYGLFANINVTEFGRTMSNLITNAVEALPNEKGFVKVLVSKQDSQILIRIEDNGKGIPNHILNQLGQLGITHGKGDTESGSGLGIYHAKKTIESFGGIFKISSVEGEGTKVDLILNPAHSPNWFLNKICFDTSTQVVSIDDDLSIHQIWKGRFQSTQIDNSPINHLTFTSGTDFRNWHTQSKKLNTAKNKMLFLFDYELLNQSSTGLDLIEELGIGEQSILITSRFEEENIKQRCEKLNVKLIPKTMAAYVPIQIQKPKELCHILIDDDSLTHMTWELDAKEKCINFKAFLTPEEFFSQKDQFDLLSPICIDSNLGHGINGVDIAKRLYEMGFKNIHLCTGYDQSEFQNMYWIKSIRGKEPFWGI
jgi:signal transduction histidine kinase